MAAIILAISFLLLWAYILHVLTRGNLHFWRFVVGSAGLFIAMMVWVRPYLTEPLARAVAALAGLFGSLTNTFDAFFKYGILFINHADGPITLQIDFECSGIIEIMAFLSLLLFFEVYDKRERIIVGILGTAGIMLANALRIIVISEMVYFGGADMYYIAHTIVGRLVFYVLTVLLYFYVFTKPHIVRLKIGKFNYGANKTSN